MSNGTHIDPAALAAARERLEYNYQTSRLLRTETVSEIMAPDLRLVLDALREAERRVAYIEEECCVPCTTCGRREPFDEMEYLEDLATTGREEGPDYEPYCKPCAAKEQS